MKARLRAKAAGLVLTPSGREAAVVAFLDQLDRDGLTVGDLAAMARVGRSHFEQVLHGARNGRHTWKHVIPLLSNAALSRLKQCSAWNNFCDEAMTPNQTLSPISEKP